MITTSPHLYNPVGRSGLTPQTNNREPRFGFGGAESLARIFQPITEQFVYGFFAQDVVALWIPRIFNALNRGKITYDVRQDPAMQDKPPLQQLLYSWQKNIAGLNYSNATEETLREVETGPGLLIAQSILLGIASAVMIGKLALMMSFGDLKSYKEAFVKTVNGFPMGDHLKNLHPVQHQRELLQRFMNDLLIKGHFKDGLSKKLPTKLSANDKELISFLRKHYPNKQSYTYQEALESWVKEWARLNPKRSFDTRFVAKNDELSQVFRRLVFWYNDNVKKVTNPAELNKLDVPHLGKGATSTTDAVLENARKFKTFMQDTHRLAQKPVASLGKQGWGSNMQKALVEAADKVFKGTVVRKSVLSIVATLLAGVTVVAVSAIAQRGKSYPANRTLQLPQGSSTGTAPGRQVAFNFAPAFRGNSSQQHQQVLTPNFSRQFQQPVHQPAAAFFFDPALPSRQGGQR